MLKQCPRCNRSFPVLGPVSVEHCVPCRRELAGEGLTKSDIAYRKFHDTVAGLLEQAEVESKRAAGAWARINGLEAELRRRGWPNPPGRDADTIAALTAEIERLQDPGAARDETICRLADRIALLEHENAGLREEVGRLKSNQSGTNYRAINVQLRRELGGMRRTIGELRTELVAANMRVRELTRQMMGTVRAGGIPAPPEGVNVRDFIKIAHPDRWAGTAQEETANVMTKWLLDIYQQRRQRRGR